MREREQQRGLGEIHITKVKEKKVRERELFLLWIANEKTALIKAEKYS